jgi:hypothetical protein
MGAISKQDLKIIMYRAFQKSTTGKNHAKNQIAINFEQTRRLSVFRAQPTLN